MDHTTKARFRHYYERGHGPGAPLHVSTHLDPLTDGETVCGRPVGRRPDVSNLIGEVSFCEECLVAVQAG